MLSNTRSPLPPVSSIRPSIDQRLATLSLPHAAGASSADGNDFSDPLKFAEQAADNNCRMTERRPQRGRTDLVRGLSWSKSSMANALQ